MPVLDTINRAFRDFVRFTGDGKPNAPVGAPLPIGDPRSGRHNPALAEIRNALIEIAQTQGDPAALQDIMSARDLSTVPTWNVTNSGAGAANTIVGAKPATLAQINEVDGSLSLLRTHFANTGPVTFNGKPLVNANNTPLAAGSLKANYRYIIRYAASVDSYVLVTGGVMPSDVSAIGSAAILGASPPTTGTTSIGNRQWVAGRSYVEAGAVFAVEVNAATVGEIEIAAFSISGSTLTKGDRLTVPITKAGLQTILLDREIAIQPGEKVGWWATPGLIRATSPLIDGMGGYYSNGSANTGKGESFTSALSTDVRFTINFRIRFGEATGALATALDALRNTRNTQSAGTSWPDTKSYVLVWAVGQSNGAGRGRTPSEFAVELGRGYKYDTTAGITHLVEPTGLDSLAQSNGYVSFASGAAVGLLEATAGRVGVIFVNSCVGATTIEDWASGTPVWSGAQSQINTALSQLETQRFNIVGTISIFCHGEGNIGSTKASYKAGVLDLLARMKTHLALPRLKTLIVQTGTNDNGDNSGFVMIRQAQTELANESDGSIIMAHAGARYFPQRDLMFDELHYTTQGYDEIGSALGAAVAAYGIGLRPPVLD